MNSKQAKRLRKVAGVRGTVNAYESTRGKVYKDCKHVDEKGDLIVGPFQVTGTVYMGDCPRKRYQYLKARYKFLRKQGHTVQLQG